jgi:hypothetical protein
MTNNETVTVSLDLTLRQAHLLSIVCGLNVTVPKAATQRSEFLIHERLEGSPEMSAAQMGVVQRLEVRRALNLLRESLHKVTPSAHLAKTSEIFTNSPDGLI